MLISDNGLMCFSLLQLSESPLPHCDLCPVYPPILSLSLNPLHILSSPSASLDSLAIIRSIFLHFISYLTLSLCTFLFWKTLTLIKSHSALTQTIKCGWENTPIEQPLTWVTCLALPSLYKGLFNYYFPSSKFWYLLLSPSTLHSQQVTLLLV